MKARSWTGDRAADLLQEASIRARARTAYRRDGMTADAERCEALAIELTRAALAALENPIS
jgi:hypothetical protein